MNCAFRWFVLTVAVAALSSAADAQTASDKFLGTRWDLPGPKNAALSPPLGGTFGPGAANWSIMGPGIGILGGDGDHPGGEMTRAFDTLLPGELAGTAQALFEQALDMWAAASVSVPGSGFAKLAMAADGGGRVGEGAAGVGMDGTVGDIRAGVLDIVGAPPSSFPDFDVIAHAFRPDTDAQMLFHGGFSSVGGDVHFRPHKFGDDMMEFTPDDEPNGVKWINWQPGDPAPAFDEIDLLTVMLHEVGHALGLGHNINPATGAPFDATSVMVPIYPGVRQTLSGMDVANVQELYNIPEPSTLCLFALAAFALGARRFRRSRR